MTVKDKSDESANVVTTVSVLLNDSPSAEFTLQQDGASVECTDQSTDTDATVVGWLWDFGDGNTSAEQNPTHTYSGPGEYAVALAVTDDCDETGTSPPLIVTVGDQPPLFLRGDPNGDGVTNVTDGIFLLNYLFLGGPAPTCLESGDADDDGAIIISDGIFVLNFLFLGGPSPPAPGQPGPNECGPDPVDSPAYLGCDSYSGCAQ